MAHVHVGNNRVESLSQNRRRMTIVFCITLLFAVVEGVGGVLSNSLALVSDAGHMLIDAAAVGLSLFAIIFAMRPPSSMNTYSMGRVEIIAAFINGLTLMGIAVYIFYEAWERLYEPPEIKAGLMLAVALLGLASMIAGAVLLWDGSHGNLNIKGAFLHILGDLLGSLGTVAGAVIILATGWTAVDTVISVAIGLLIVYSSWGLMKDSVHILMEGAPSGLDIDRVRESILAVEGVAGLHDFHVWSLTTGVPMLTAHVEVRDTGDGAGITEKITHVLEHEYHIDHATIQVEDVKSANCNVNC